MRFRTTPDGACSGTPRKEDRHVGDRGAAGPARGSRPARTVQRWCMTSRSRSASRRSSGVRWSQGRCGCGSRPRACATPTSTRRTATGRSSRRRRSSRDTRASASSRSSGPASSRSASAIGSRCRGSATPAGRATTACPAGRRSASTQQNIGYSIDGGYAEYAAAYARYVVQVPDGVDPMDAAPLTCAGVTTYKAIKVSGARSSDLVAVFGVGGLGHMAVQYARIAGATVVAVDVHDEKLELAQELGAKYTVNASTEDPADAIQELGGADGPSPWPYRPRRSSRRTARCGAAGRSCFVALPAENPDAADLRDRAQRHQRRRLDRRHPRGPGEVFELHAAGRTEVTLRRGRWTRSTRRSPTSRQDTWQLESSSVPDVVTMYARAVDESAARLRELRHEERSSLGLGALALALSLVATSLRPELAVPLFIGGIAVGALGVRAVWHRWDIVDRLLGERDSYVISEIRERAVYETTMERRRVLAAGLRGSLREPMSDRVQGCGRGARASRGGARGQSAGARAGVRSRLQATPGRSRAKPASEPGIPCGGSTLGCPPDPVRLRVPGVLTTDRRRGGAARALRSADAESP